MPTIPTVIQNIKQKIYEKLKPGEHNKLKNSINELLGTNQSRFYINPRFIKKEESSLFSLLFREKLPAIDNFSYIVKFKGETLALTPYYYATGFHSVKKKFIAEKGPSGAASFIYLKYINQNSKKEKTNILFKKTKLAHKELFGLYFNLLIYKYYAYNNNYNNNYSKLQYLCELKEFGAIMNQDFYYAYMSNCGIDLYKISDRNIPQNQLIKFIKVLFTQCLEALQLIHDLNYLHLDIKPENFLFSMDGNNLESLQIKIIDFGLVQKNGYITDTIFGTNLFIPNDWVKKIMFEKINIILKKHHDFFELGCTILEILFQVFNKINKSITVPFMFCPIQYLEDIKDRKHILAIKKDYDLDQHNLDMKYINEILIYFGISESNANNIVYILYIMCHPDPIERFTSSQEILLIVQSINLLNVKTKSTPTKLPILERARNLKFAQARDFWRSLAQSPDSARSL